MFDFLSLDTITKMVMYAVAAISVLTVVMLFIRIKRNKNWKKVTAIFLIALMIINIVLTFGVNKYNILVNQYLTGVTGDTISEEEATDVTENSRLITEALQQEGTVLLKNSAGTLPIEPGNVNVFGYASQEIVYGGSGSGAGDESKNITLEKGLQNAGFTMNRELIQFYKSLAGKREEVDIFNLVGGDFNVYEPDVSEYSDELISNAKSFSNTAIVVFARSGGEGGDLPMDMDGYIGGSQGKHYLELADNEIDMLEMVKNNFDKVILLINSSNAMELGFVESDAIDAVLWIGGPGSTGLNSVGKILSGEINPSGRLADTYAYDATSSPAYYNAGDFTYLNTLHTETNHMGGSNEEYYKFVNYSEGIYVGYRYYETRYVDDTGKVDEEAYSSVVQYPFGYGLSYTEFNQNMVDMETNRDQITVKVEVENIGNVAGKEVVQLYYTPPYTMGGIEKSHVVLAAFNKTKLLQPGEKETLALSFAIEDMASYDYTGERCYVLEEGDYHIKLMNNAHDVIDTRIYTVGKKKVYGDRTPRNSDQQSAVNRLDDAAGDIVYLSRTNWEKFQTMRTKDQNAADALIKLLQDVTVQEDQDTEDIVFADNGLTLADMTGVDYNDKKWDRLLEQLTIDEMKTLIGFGGFQTAEIKSVEKQQNIDIDGPAGLNGLVNKIRGVQFCSEVVIASTWNTELVELMGKTLAEEAIAYKVSGLYAPGANIHRTPFSGRNFEYYSEDSTLSGKMAAATIKGGRNEGVSFYVKHFALNDQEQNRLGLVTWCNEQAIREIYLKPFELAVKEGRTNGIMTSFNRIGARWAGASKPLLTDILRGEWGFEGVVISDYVLNPSYMNVDQAIAAGNDMMLSTMGVKVSADTPTQRNNMRNACKNILFAVANSEMIESNGIALWIWLYCAFEIILMAGLIFGLLLSTRKRKS